MDLQYVGEPRVEATPKGLAVVLETDVLLYEAFDGVDACVDVFEDVLAEALAARLEKKVRGWLKRRPA